MLRRVRLELVNLFRELYFVCLRQGQLLVGVPLLLLKSFDLQGKLLGPRVRLEPGPARSGSVNDAAADVSKLRAHLLQFLLRRAAALRLCGERG